MPKILLLEDIPEASAWLKLQIAQVFPDAEFHDTSRVHEALTLIEKVQFEFALIDLGLLAAAKWLRARPGARGSVLLAHRLHHAA